MVRDCFSELQIPCTDIRLIPSWLVTYLYITMLGKEYGVGLRAEPSPYTARADCLLQLTPAGSYSQYQQFNHLVATVSNNRGPGLSPDKLLVCYPISFRSSILVLLFYPTRGYHYYYDYYDHYYYLEHCRTALRLKNNYWLLNRQKILSGYI